MIANPEKPALILPIAAPAVERWQPILKASQHFGIPQTWIATVMQTGSAG